MKQEFQGLADVIEYWVHYLTVPIISHSMLLALWID